MAVTTRTGGRTQQGRTPSPTPNAPGAFGPATGSPPRRSGGRTQQATQQSTPRSGGRTQQATQGGGTVKPTPKSQRPAPYRTKAPAARSGSSQRRAPSAVSTATRTGRQFTSPEFSNYQGIILAEFVVAELLVAATPIASTRKTPGLSPYVPRDMTKLLAIGVVYFLLELLAVGGRSTGRFGAWFGALILLGVGMNEAANIIADLDLLSGATAAATATEGSVKGSIKKIVDKVKGAKNG